jgi:hypothetical protein
LELYFPDSQRTQDISLLAPKKVPYVPSLQFKHILFLWKTVPIVINLLYLPISQYRHTEEFDKTRSNVPDCPAHEKVEEDFPPFTFDFKKSEIELD